MSLLKQLLKRYVETNLHVSFAVISLVLLTYDYTGVSVDGLYVAFAGLGTFVAYTYIKNVPPQVSLRSSLSHVIKQSPNWVHAAALVFLGLTPMLNESQFFALVAVALLCLGYILPWPVLKHIKNVRSMAKSKPLPLRDFGPIKIIIVALVWSVVSVIVPLLALGNPSRDIWLVFIAQTLWVVVLTIPFEIRDAGKDQLRHPTWPQKMGLMPVKFLGSVLLIASLAIHVWLFYVAEPGAKDSFLDEPYMIAMLLTAVGLLWAKPNQSFWYSALWIEAIPIFWLILCGLFSF